MIHYNGFRTHSWSQSARTICDRTIQSVNNGYITIEEAREYLHGLTRNPIIVKRACKRLGKAIRESRVHETQEAVNARKEREDVWESI